MGKKYQLIFPLSFCARPANVRRGAQVLSGTENGMNSVFGFDFGSAVGPTSRVKAYFRFFFFFFGGGGGGGG